MTREIGRNAVEMVARWGFAALVGCGAVAATVSALDTDAPAGVPSYALRAEAVYRCEVGAAIFLIVYFVALMLALAVRNRAFTEIGRGSLRAADISGAGQDDVLREQAESLEALTAIVEGMRPSPQQRDRRED